MKKTLYVLGILVTFLLGACGGDEFKKTPVDELIKELDKEPLYSIILHDMDVDGAIMKTYKHQYKIITTKDSLPQERITDWKEVSSDFFLENEKNMGMEIASKTADGKVSRTIGPAGYSNFVGNPQYGKWSTGSGGDSFWEWYGKYAMMSSILSLAMMPIQMSMWNDYHRNYYSRGTPYYGSYNGRPVYGTYGSHTNTARKSSSWFSKSSNQSFRNNVSSRVSRSSSRGNSSGSMRSRGGGSGK